MKLEECKTVKQCLLWADQEWEGFWDFATHQPMTTAELNDLQVLLEVQKEKFDNFMEYFGTCIPGKNNLDEETKRLLILSATALKRFDDAK